jgi:hypothetical protein
MWPVWENKTPTRQGSVVASFVRFNERLLESFDDSLLWPFASSNMRPISSRQDKS